MAQEKNPPISTVLKIFTTVEFIVLATVSVVLFFLPDFGKSVWAWEIGPFNLRFLGAVYFASAVAVGSMLFVGRWAPARLILPMLFTFTFTVLVVTLIKLPTFLLDRPATWGWFILYLTLPIDALAHIWLYRKLKPANQKATSKSWSLIATILAVVLGAYGVGQLLAPALFSSFWPWAIDEFHAQLYCGIFLTAAVGLYLIRKSSAQVETLALGLTLAAWGFFALVGLALVDGQVHKVNWSLGGTYLWLSAFALILLTGLGLIYTAQKALTREI